MSELLKKLFKPGRKVSVHELYKPSRREEKRYRQWIEDQRGKEINAMVKQAYQRAAVSPEYSGFVRYYLHQTSNCISIHAGSEVQERDLLPLARWYTDRIRELGYRLVNQDRLTRELPGYVQVKTRFYLKPPISQALPAEQMYGNIILELITEDNRDVYLKCNVTSYSDRNYKSAAPFDELLLKMLHIPD